MEERSRQGMFAALGERKGKEKRERKKAKKDYKKLKKFSF